MSKKGKIAGIVALVLAIAAAVFAFLEWNQSKKYAAHYAELAESVSTIARNLDSGSGVEDQVSFTVSNGKEQGSLSMPVTKGIPGATESAVKPLVDLSADVIAQRDTIVNTVVEKVIQPLQCPAEKAPTAEDLNNVKEYEGKLDGFVGFVQARVARDNAVKTQVNQVLRLLNVRGSYSATITETGSFTDGDKKAFAEGAKNLGNLQSNYGLMVQAMREFANTLRTSQVSGVAWDSPKAAGSLGGTGLTDTESNANQNAVGQFRADMGKLKTQLARIDALESDKADLQEALADAKEEIENWKARYQQDEEVLNSLLEQFTPHASYDVKKLASAEEVDPNTTGKVMDVNTEFGYVTISLTQADVVEDLRLSVFHQGKFIAQLRVLRPMPSNTLAILEKGSAADIQKGDSVLVASPVLQQD